MKWNETHTIFKMIYIYKANGNGYDKIGYGLKIETKLFWTENSNKIDTRSNILFNFHEN